MIKVISKVAVVALLLYGVRLAAQNDPVTALQQELVQEPAVAKQQDGKKSKSKAKSKADAKSAGGYAITARRNVERINLQKKSDEGRQVEVRILRNGTLMRNAENLLLSGSSGNESITNNYLGFTAVEFPFKGHIRYTVPTKNGAALKDCEVRFEIEQKGAWVLNIYN